MDQADDGRSRRIPSLARADNTILVLTRTSSVHPSQPEHPQTEGTPELPPPRPVHESPAKPLPEPQRQTGTTVTLGTDTESLRPLTVGDTERRAGLYVLGRSGTGKSTLLVNMIAQDINNGHGVFFLDPHGDAINTLLGCVNLPRLRTDLLLLDPAERAGRGNLDKGISGFPA